MAKLTTTMVAEQLHISQDTARRLMDRPGFPAKRCGSKETRYVEPDALERWIASPDGEVWRQERMAWVNAHARRERRSIEKDERIKVRRESEFISPTAYLKVKGYLDCLNKNKRLMTYQQYKTLRGQAIHGDLDGAEKGLLTILSEKGMRCGHR